MDLLMKLGLQNVRDYPAIQWSGVIPDIYEYNSKNLI